MKKAGFRRKGFNPGFSPFYHVLSPFLNPTTLMKNVLLSACLLLSVLQLPAQVFTTVGNVTNPTGVCYCLNQGGDAATAVWFDNGIAIDFATTSILFDETFEIYLGTDDGGGHGISMTLQQEGPAAIGDGGEALGYGGASSILRALNIEIDTRADAHAGDAGAGGADHLAITTNGAYNVDPILAGPLALPNLEDGNYHSVRIVLIYNHFAPPASTVTAIIDGVHTLTAVFDFRLIFDSNVFLYYGFTGGVDGVANNEHKVSFASPGSPAACSAFTFPVELIDFRATPGPGRSVTLDWTTASELNNAYFEVRRSRDGNLWEAIGRVKGAGTTQVAQAYTFTDQPPQTGRLYYQLRQVDHDGTFSLSDRVETYVDFASRYHLSLSPNPARAHTTLRVEGITEDEELLVEMVDLTGRRMLVQHVRGQGSQEIPLDLQGFAPGLYWVRAGDPHQMVTTLLRLAP